LPVVSASTLGEVTGEVTAHAVDCVQGLRTIAAFGNGPMRAQQVEQRSRELCELKRAFWVGKQPERVQSVILDDGVIVERGSHAELAALDGALFAPDRKPARRRTSGGGGRRGHQPLRELG
jgi:hypothetical protein